jgi:O-antigen/teichoic acid export membrane protein
VSRHAAPNRLHKFAAMLHWRGTGQAIGRTAGFNLASVLAAGLGGVIVARVVGPTVQGEYTAIMAWFGIVLMVGSMGQPAALCFYVARDPMRSREYVATSRAMMLTTGSCALIGGELLAPVLAHGNEGVAMGYRLAFGASVVAFVGASYTFSLQARDLRRWNVARILQPVLSLIAIGTLACLKLLSLYGALIALCATMLLQLIWAYRCCRVTGLVPGRPQIRLVRPLAAYGTAQIAALTPAVLNANLDQLVLSQTVPSADLGRYAIAVSLASLPMPLVSAIGNVAFPRLAARSVVTEATLRLQLLAVLASAGLAVAILVPLAVAAYWMIPLVFGANYRGAVVLLWLLAPGSVFLACGQVVGDLLRGRNHPNVVAWSQGLAAVFTVLLLLMLLPMIGVAGAAVASTVAYGIALAAMLRSLWRLPRHARGRGWVRESHMRLDAKQ